MVQNVFPLCIRISKAVNCFVHLGHQCPLMAFTKMATHPAKVGWSPGH